MSDFGTHAFAVDGMHCDACVRRVTHALGSIPGVRVHHVEIGRAEVLAETSTHAAIADAIEKAGFTVHGVSSTTH